MTVALKDGEARNGDVDGTKDKYEYFEDGRDGRGTECGRGEERLRPDGRRNANNEFRLRELRGTEYRGN